MEGQTDRQNCDPQDHASIAASGGKNVELTVNFQPFCCFVFYTFFVTVYNLVLATSGNITVCLSQHCPYVIDFLE